MVRPVMHEYVLLLLPSKPEAAVVFAVAGGLWLNQKLPHTFSVISVELSPEQMLLSAQVLEVRGERSGVGGLWRQSYVNYKLVASKV